MQTPKSVRAQIFFNFIKAIFRIKAKHYMIYQLQGHGIWSLTLVHVGERVRRWYIAILTLKRYIENRNSTPQIDKEPHDEDKGTLYSEFLFLSGMNYIIASWCNT